MAETAAHFTRMIEAAGRGDDVEPLRGERHPAIDALIEAVEEQESFEDVERRDVHDLFWSGSAALEAAAAERLAARYRDRSWGLLLASIEAQRRLVEWQDRVDAAYRKLE